MHGHIGGSRKIEPGRHLSELFEGVVYGCFVWVGYESVDKYRDFRRNRWAGERVDASTGSCGKSVIFPHLVGFHSSRQNIY